MSNTMYKIRFNVMIFLELLDVPRYITCLDLSYIIMKLRILTSLSTWLYNSAVLQLSLRPSWISLF